MPPSQGLLPQVGPWGKSLHPFAGALHGNFGELLGLVCFLCFF